MAAARGPAAWGCQVLSCAPPLPAAAAPQVDHPNCIKLNAVYITPRKVYIVTELVSGGELLDRWPRRARLPALPAARPLPPCTTHPQAPQQAGAVPEPAAACACAG